MQPNKSKATLQLVIATLLSLFGMLLLGAAFVTAPPGEIHSSVLIAYGEVMTFAGALFGIDYHYRRQSMPTPRHPRHLPATLSLWPYHPHPHPNSSAYSTRSPRSTGSPYSTATYAPHHALPPPLHTLPLYMHLAPTSYRTF